MKIAVLLSGGVDSSVALRLLHQQGHTLTAFYIKIWLEDELSYLGDCPWEEDLKYARAVCKQIAVPLEVISLQKEYWDEVVAYTLAELRAGRTPNPDILCNQRIKFGKFYQAIDPSFEKVATGHYAQLEIRNPKSEIRNNFKILNSKFQTKKNIYLLKKSADSFKDQTYFLCHLSQKQLSRALFPIGHLTKKDVRSLAKEYDLPNKDRKDSQGICFLGQVHFREFIKHHLGTRRGNLVDLETGETMGEHEGYWFYTIGQRQGLGIGGSGPWYVVKKEIKKNIVYVTRQQKLPEKLKKRLNIQKINWGAGTPPKKREIDVRIRHQGELYRGHFILHRNKTATIELKKPATDVAPGQFAAFYQGDYCLGGGIIDTNP